MELRPGLSTGISDADRFPGVFNALQGDGMGLGEEARDAIQALIEAAEAAGNAVVDIPPGTYTLSTALNIRTGGIHLRGAGSTRTTLKARDGTPVDRSSIFLREPPSMLVIGTDEGAIGSDADDVIVSGITFDGNVGAYTDDVILGNDRMNAISIMAGNRLTFRDLVIRDTPRNGISCSDLVSSAHEDITIEFCDFFDIGQHPIFMLTTKRGRIQFCNFERSGDSLISLSNKSVDTSLGGCEDCEVLFCHGTRDAPPTRIFNLDLSPSVPGIFESGKLIAIVHQARRILLMGNVMIDNRNAAQDGFGSVVAFGDTVIQDFLPMDCRIIANHVELTGGFGIDIGIRFIVQDNIVIKPATHGLYYGLDLGGDLDGTQIINNKVVDADENDVGLIAGILLGGGLVSDLCTSSNTVIEGNQVMDTRSPKQCAFGISVGGFHDPDSLFLDGNRCQDVLTNSLRIFGAVTNLRLGHNHFKPDEWYGTLELVAGTVNTATLPMPSGTAMVATISRTDKLASTGIGNLEALSVPATPRFTLNALDAAAALETNDVSEVVWQCTGTADAY